MRYTDAAWSLDEDVTQQRGHQSAHTDFKADSSLPVCIRTRIGQYDGPSGEMAKLTGSASPSGPCGRQIWSL